MHSMATSNSRLSYSTMLNQDNDLFDDKSIPRFDADTFKHRYGNNWKTLATNVREVPQPDGSIIKEYIIEDPSLLEQIQTSSQTIDSKLMVADSDDDRQHVPRHRFAEIKAKFEKKDYSNVMDSPFTSTTNSTSTRSYEVSRQNIDSRRVSNTSKPQQKLNSHDSSSTHSHNTSNDVHNGYRRSQSSITEESKIISFRRVSSVDEADEEVRQIHQQGEELRRHSQPFSHATSSETGTSHKRQAQYEIVDENGSSLQINNVQDLIKISGARIREVPQPDGSVVKEYVIDDPQILSKLRSQQQLSTNSYGHHQQIGDDEPPPPPPRIPLRPSTLFRQGNSSINDHLSYNIQQIHVLEPQQRYEYLTRTGRRVEFVINNNNSFYGPTINDFDIRELVHAINNRLVPLLSTVPEQKPSTAQASFNQSKQWRPSVDFSYRKRVGSDSQSYPSNNQYQIPKTLSRSSSFDELNQESFASKTHQLALNESMDNKRTVNRYQDHPTSTQVAHSQQRMRSIYSPPDES